MARQEQAPHYETERPRVDCLIVLGRNFQPGFDRKVLAEQRFHLSPQSRINALAAALIYKAGFTDRLIISTGHTAGSNVPSEARAMKNHMQRIFKDIPDKAIILEETSIDTVGNVKEVKKIVEKHPELKTFGLLTDTSHLTRAIPLFEKIDIMVKPFDALDILGKEKKGFMEKYLQSEVYKKTEIQDRKSKQIHNFPIISPLTSRFLHQIALKKRNPNKYNPYMVKNYDKK